jgi:hypothetical protein
MKRVSNPLTIIAIFAGFAEIAGTFVLPFLDGQNQNIFLWFVMLFPALLVVCFFMTLNFNHKVLYAPSDFRSDESFLAASNFTNTEVVVADIRTVQGIKLGAPSINQPEMGSD